MALEFEPCSRVCEDPGFCESVVRFAVGQLQLIDAHTDTLQELGDREQLHAFESEALALTSGVYEHTLGFFESIGCEHEPQVLRQIIATGLED